MATNKYHPFTGRYIETTDLSPFIPDPWDQIPGHIAISKTSNVAAAATVAEHVPATDPRPADPRPDGIGPDGAGLTHNLTGTDVSTADQSLAVTTDQPDYSPGSTAIFTASNVAVGDAVQFSVAHLDPGPDGIVGTADDRLTHDLTGTKHPWTVTDGGVGDLDGLVNGAIQTSWYVNADAMNQAFVLTAADHASGQVATTSFTDAAPSTAGAAADLTFETTTVPGGEPTHLVNGALFQVYNVKEDFGQSSGTGIFDTFVEIQGPNNSSLEQGYNYDRSGIYGNALSPQFNEDTSGVHNKALPLNTIPIVVVNGVAYRELLLDSNESNGGNNEFISLDRLMVFQESSGNLGVGHTPSSNDTPFSLLTPGFNVPNNYLVYNLDAGVDRWIALDSNLSSGSGDSDIRILIPDSSFLNDANHQFVYVYSAFGIQGGDWNVQSGFEEWATNPANLVLASLSGTKFGDADGLASTTGDRTALSGWVITLHGDTNGDGTIDVTQTATTDASGHYTFSSLIPGVYTTDETLKSGWFQVSGSSTETLTSGENDSTGNDFVNSQVGSLSGTKFGDADGLAGTTADRTPLSGWVITLHGDSNGDGTPDTQTATTDQNGNYTFSNLHPGVYTTTEDFTGHTGYFLVSGSSTETLTSGENDSTGNDFVNSQVGSLSGTKFGDADGLAGTTADRTPLSGWVITLHGDSNGDGTPDTQTATTDQNGNYTFSNLHPGVYTTTEDFTGHTGYFLVSGSSTETLTSGENDSTGNDFVNSQVGSLSGTKFGDADGLAGTTADRTPLSGWVITLHGDSNGDGTPDTQTATTDQNGNYTFSNLHPGVYTTTEDFTGHTGYFLVSGSSTETLTSGENDSTGNDFVNSQVGSLSGTKFGDADGLAGTTDDRTPLSGWVITLHGDSNGDGTPDTQTATTDQNGNYTFSNLHPGVYTTTEDFTGHTGYFLVSGSSTETLTSGENDSTGNDFVNSQVGSLSGTKFGDADGLAGTTDDRTPLSGWVITLHGDSNGDGTPDTQTATTDQNGNYTFSNLHPGVYTTTEDFTGHTGYFLVSGSSTETLTSGENDSTGNDFVNSQVGSLSGTKFGDADGLAGTTDDRTPLSGWVITLHGDSNGDGTPDTQTATTDQNGNYTFSDLHPGVYTTTEDFTGHTGYFLVSGSSTETLTSGENDSTGNDFVNSQGSSISGTKFGDADGLAGTTDDRTPLSGWVITLHGDSNGDGTPDTQTATTDQNGNYTFSNLHPGVYTTTEDFTGHTGYFLVSGSSTETLTSGENDSTGNDFVNSQVGSLSGTKFGDADGLAGTTDDRTPLSGWVITLHGDSNGDGTPDTQTATTDQNGNYTFSDLHPGVYTTTEDFTGHTGYFLVSGSSTETLTSGENDSTGNDFVNSQVGSLSGTKFGDADGLAGTTDDRTPLSGWVITLHGDSNGDGTPDTQTATTDQNGNYTFSDLHPGVYTTTEDFTGHTGYFLVSGSSTETLTSGENDSTGNDFVNSQVGSLSGTKFGDADGLAGTTDDRTPLSGWVITLHGDSNGDGTPDTQTATTDQDGHYTFSDLHPGVYTTTEDFTGHTGYFLVSGSSTETLTSGENDSTGNDFVNSQVGSISGTKFGDADGLAGTTDDRTPLSGWVITLHGDSNGDGTPDTQTATTDQNGNYTFSDLHPGVYTTDETLQSGWVQVSGSSTVTLTSGENDTTGNDFVNFQPPTGQGVTPGFWKNHVDVVNEELAEVPGGYTAGSQYEDVFGVDLNGSRHFTLLEALGANGGGQNQLLRMSTAAFISAVTDAGDDGAPGGDPAGKIELNFSFSAATGDAATVAILQQIDLNHDSKLQPNEVINAVQDVYNVNVPGVTHFFGVTGQPGITDVANAFAAINNQPHPDSSVF